MSLRNALFYTFSLLFCLIVQILFLRDLVLFNYAFCFLYIGAILVLPPEMDKMLYLLIAFLTGIVLDMFMNTLGLHASATVAVAYARSFVIDRQARLSGEELVTLSLRRVGFVVFTRVVFPLVLLHSTMLFLIEANSLNLILYTVIRIVASSVFTMTGILIWQSFVKQ